MSAEKRDGGMALILLIEDEASVREMLVDELTVQGHEVVVACNGAEGLKKFLENEPDLVLCDRAMPGMSGFEVLQRLRGAHPQFNDVPFVFLTALSDPRDRAAVAHLNPADYLAKPIDFDVLSEKIKALI